VKTPEFNIQVISENNMNHIKLPLKTNTVKLKKELDKIVLRGWHTQKPFSTSGVPGLTTTTYHEGGWKIISLRSIGGDSDRTDPGGPSLVDYEYTNYLDVAPYMKSILNQFGSYVRTARLSVLNPGEKINRHCDTYIAFKYGQVRLHIPIITNDKVEVNISGESQNWGEGELWYGDFSKNHSVINNGNTPRIHLIFDVCLSSQLLSIFPEEFISKIDHRDFLIHKKGISLHNINLKKYECSFILSAGVIKGIFEFDDGIPGEYLGRISVSNNKLVFYINNSPISTLVPVSDSEFRFMGWSMERLILIELGGEKVTSLSFKIVSGRYFTSVKVPVL